MISRGSDRTVIPIRIVSKLRFLFGKLKVERLEFYSKRTISKHQYQTHRLFEGAEPVRRSRPLTVFSAKKFEKTMINREIEQKQRRNHQYALYQ